MSVMRNVNIVYYEGLGEGDRGVCVGGGGGGGGGGEGAEGLNLCYQ